MRIPGIAYGPFDDLRRMVEQGEEAARRVRQMEEAARPFRDIQELARAVRAGHDAAEIVRNGYENFRAVALEYEAAARAVFGVADRVALLTHSPIVDDFIEQVQRFERLGVEWTGIDTAFRSYAGISAFAGLALEPIRLSNLTLPLSAFDSVLGRGEEFDLFTWRDPESATLKSAVWVESSIVAASTGISITVEHDVSCMLCEGALYSEGDELEWVSPVRVVFRSRVLPLCARCTSEGMADPDFWPRVVRALAEDFEVTLPDSRKRFPILQGGGEGAAPDHPKVELRLIRSPDDKPDDDGESG
jgi:hypothetical protein